MAPVPPRATGQPEALDAAFLRERARYIRLIAAEFAENPQALHIALDYAAYLESEADDLDESSG